MNNRHIQFTEAGFPVYAFKEGGNMVATTPGVKPKDFKKKSASESFGSVEPNKKEFSGSRDWVPWGTNDRFPDDVMNLVRPSGVASSALRLMTLKLFGQQVVP